MRCWPARLAAENKMARRHAQDVTDVDTGITQRWNKEYIHIRGTWDVGEKFSGENAANIYFFLLFISHFCATSFHCLYGTPLRHWMMVHSLVNQTGNQQLASRIIMIIARW